ncbi:hypothetical protein ACFL5F_02315 [Planctomycetota bacterium]
MSGIRKLKRYKSLRRKQKTSSKLLLGEIVLYVGIAMLLSGIFYGIYNYDVYTSGRPEHTTESKGGPIHHPEEAPGNPGRKESSATGWTIAGIGIVLIILSIFISIIGELLHDTVGKLRGKRLLRKGK